MNLHKTLLTSSLGIALGCSTLPAMAADLAIRVENLEPDRGQLYLRIVNSEQAFDQDFNSEASATVSHMIEVDGETLSWTAKALEPGTYAVQSFQDLNEDKELDTGLFGIPTEPWGMSRNPSGSFGPPDWEDARLTLTESGDSITIRMNKWDR